jgi:hypothetical protein
MNAEKNKKKIIFFRILKMLVRYGLGLADGPAESRPRALKRKEF